MDALSQLNSEWVLLLGCLGCGILFFFFWCWRKCQKINRRQRELTRARVNFQSPNQLDMAGGVNHDDSWLAELSSRQEWTAREIANQLENPIQHLANMKKMGPVFTVSIPDPAPAPAQASGSEPWASNPSPHPDQGPGPSSSSAPFLVPVPVPVPVAVPVPAISSPVPASPGSEVVQEAQLGVSLDYIHRLHANWAPAATTGF